LGAGEKGKLRRKPPVAGLWDSFIVTVGWAKRPSGGGDRTLKEEGDLLLQRKNLSGPAVRQSAEA